MTLNNNPRLSSKLYREYGNKYFRHEYPDTWDVVHYMEHYAKLTDINFPRATSNWVGYLKQASTSPDSIVASRAKTLLTRYSEKGRRSDQVRASAYYRKHKREIQRKHPPAAVSLQAVGDNYGTLILNGQGRGQTTKVVAQTDPSSPCAPCPEPSTVLPASTSLADLLSHPSSSTQSSATPSESGFLADREQSPTAGVTFPARTGLAQLISLLHDYGSHIKTLDLSQFSIIDSSDLQLMSVLKNHGYDFIPDVYQMPSFPKPLEAHLALYANVTTILGCKQVSLDSEEQWSSPHIAPDLLFCKRWIDMALQIVVHFITGTHGLLQQNLGEGAWEGIYWNLLDLAFTSHPCLMLQRRDILLHALETDPNPITRSSRYDGVVRTRDPSTVHNSRLEFLVVEVSRKFEKSDSLKWNSDMGKLHAACRSMLGILKTAVRNDPITVKKLAVVGILQAGRVTLVLVMSCIGENLYYLRRGKTWLLPLHLHEFENIFSLIIAFWKAREIAYSTYQTVIDYMRLHERLASRWDSDPEFL